MDNHSQSFKIRLGLFVAIGLGLFVFTIFIIGKQKNLFDPVYKLKTNFYNVSGLQVGNIVRYAGINVGTVENITIINDSTVSVDMLIKKEVQKFIKSDCGVAIGSEGLVGDRLLMITLGSTNSPIAKEGQSLQSIEPIETAAVMASLARTAHNAEKISQDMVEVMYNINNQKGIVGRLIKDSVFAENINKTIINLKKGSKGLNENMNAAKDNFLLKPYFKKKEKEAAEKKKEKEEAAEKKKEDK